jgi:hypothetical protein
MILEYAAPTHTDAWRAPPGHPSLSCPPPQPQEAVRILEDALANLEAWDWHKGQYLSGTASYTTEGQEFTPETLQRELKSNNCSVCLLGGLLSSWALQDAKRPRQVFFVHKGVNAPALLHTYWMPYHWLEPIFGWPQLLRLEGFFEGVLSVARCPSRAELEVRCGCVMTGLRNFPYRKRAQVALETALANGGCLVAEPYDPARYNKDLPLPNTALQSFLDRVSGDPTCLPISN